MRDARCLVGSDCDLFKVEAFAATKSSTVFEALDASDRDNVQLASMLIFRATKADSWVGEHLVKHQCSTGEPAAIACEGGLHPC